MVELRIELQCHGLRGGRPKSKVGNLASALGAQLDVGGRIGIECVEHAGGLHLRRGRQTAIGIKGRNDQLALEGGAYIQVYRNGPGLKVGQVRKTGPQLSA